MSDNSAGLGEGPDGEGASKNECGHSKLLNQRDRYTVGVSN